MSEQTEQVKPEKKEKKNFLAADARERIVDQLKNLDITTDGLTDQELVTKLTEALTRVNSEYMQRETETLEKQLENYGSGALITNKTFLNRLMELNVPKDFLPIFRNEDSVMSDADVWEKIRFSGLKQIDDINEIFRSRAKRTRKPSMKFSK